MAGKGLLAEVALNRKAKGLVRGRGSPGLRRKRPDNWPARISKGLWGLAEGRWKVGSQAEELNPGL